MPPAVVTAAAVVTGGAPIVAGAIGRHASEGERVKAEGLMNEALAEIRAVGAPPDLSKEIILEKFRSAGILNPAMEQEISAGFSKMAQVPESPELRNAQMEALQLLREKGKAGLTAEDRAAINQVRQEVVRDAEGKRQQIIQNMAQRGISGSGVELAAQLANQQGQAERQSAEGDRLSALASQRALEGMSQYGALAGNIQQSDFERASARAKAEDEMNRFNVQNRIGTQQRNVGAMNEAQRLNLANQQAIMDANVKLANDEKQRQVEAQRQYWQDKLSGAQVLAGQLRQASAEASQRAADIQGQHDKIGSAISGGASMIAGGGGGIGGLIGGAAGKLGKTAGGTGTQSGALYDDKTVNMAGKGTMA